MKKPSLNFPFSCRVVCINYHTKLCDNCVRSPNAMNNFKKTDSLSRNNEKSLKIESEHIKTENDLMKLARELGYDVEVSIQNDIIDNKLTITGRTIYLTKYYRRK